MKKILLCLSLLAVMAMPAYGAQETPDAATTATSVETHDPVGQFTGKYWVNSLETNKEAYLFGIESVIAVDDSIANHPEKRAKKRSAYVISPFEEGWMKAFTNTPRKQIAAEVDKWYEEHPDQLDRPVLSVIWYELIKPRLDNMEKQGKE